MQKYSQFAKLLSKALTERKSLKNLIFTYHKDPNFIRQAYGVLIKALNNWEAILDIIETLEEKSKQQIQNKYLLGILILEMFNPTNKKKKIGGKLTSILKQNQPFIEKMLLKYKVFETRLIKENVSIRVIDCNLSVDKAELVSLQNTLVPIQDKHIPNLYSTSYQKYSDYLKQIGQVDKPWFVVQSKSSAMPPFLLLRCLENRQNMKFDIIDCCAAPGNKTFQLAEFIKTRGVQGKVYAFEKSKTRFEVLKKRVKQFGFQDIIDCRNRDFLTINPCHNKFRKVKFIMLDPSCSGSGMVQQRFLENTESNLKIDVPPDKKEQVTSLAEMQLTLLNHCSKFPKVLRIIYSTCSIYEEENECVSNSFLVNQPDWKAVTVFKEWEHRGTTNNEYVRFRQDRDDTDGFFIALFKRRKDPVQTQ